MTIDPQKWNSQLVYIKASAFHLQIRNKLSSARCNIINNDKMHANDVLPVKLNSGPFY